MFLPNNLFKLELQRTSCWKEFLKYRSILRKIANNSLRIDFLECCLKSCISPRFLMFRIPNNGCFDDCSVEEFQQRLLRKEIVKAKSDKSAEEAKLTEIRNHMKEKVSTISYSSHKI